MTINKTITQIKITNIINRIFYAIHSKLLKAKISIKRNIQIITL